MKPCEKEIFETGSVALIIQELSSSEIEEWVGLVRDQSGQRVDWHRYAGRGVVRYLGDGGRVREAMVALKDDLTKRITNHLKQYDDPGIELNLTDADARAYVDLAYGNMFPKL